MFRAAAFALGLLVATASAPLAEEFTQPISEAKADLAEHEILARCGTLFGAMSSYDKFDTGTAADERMVKNAGRFFLAAAVKWGEETGGAPADVQGALSELIAKNRAGYVPILERSGTTLADSDPILNADLVFCELRTMTLPIQ